MKRRSFYALGLLAILALLLSAGSVGVLAQGPEPPHPPIHRNPPHQPPYGRTFNPEDPFHPPSLELSTTTQVEGSSVTLGEPGLSFRYVQTFGETEEPYQADAEHLYGPNGMFIDASDNLYMVEVLGHRMLKFNASGINQLVIGYAGQPWHHDDYLAYPEDVAVSSNGHIWIIINPAVKEYDENGQLVQILPATDPWQSGTDNDRFNEPRGIAFDAAGKLYVSDTQNHRIQVYDVSGGSPVYSTTIGETGVSGSDNSHFNEPARIAFDSSDRLYVVDTANYRVQRCEYTTSWGCGTFYGVTGVPGSDLTHLEWAYGVTIDSSDNIYVADGGNYRVLKCDTSGSCGHFAGVTGERGWDNDHFWWPADVVVDSAEYVYVSDLNNHRVQKFDSSGSYVETIGITRLPYVVDTMRLNAPWGIAVASDGSIYVTENLGYRVVKMDSGGTQSWANGEPGIFGTDDDHFGDWWAGPQGNVGVDSSGRVYVADTANHRVQIFNASGTLVGTLGTYGSGYYQFDCPAGVAISPINDDIYVVDHCNHRIQVFDINRIYKATLGETGVSGDDDDHFNYPRGVAVDSSGNIFVADSDNHRVQKCTLSGSSGTCTTFAGETGVYGDDFGHLHPLAVVIDDNGQVYVVDEWNSRVQVFDSSGAYLTTIGGQWGTNTGDLIGPSGIALDRDGNVYVTDRDNHRIQKFSPGVPGWIQTNINGFGNHSNAIPSLEIFNDQMYVGNWISAEIWRTSDGQTWNEITPPWSNSDNGVLDLLSFGTHLYAGTWSGDIGGIWRTNGTTWEQVISDGFGDSNNYGVNALAVYDGELYAATSNETTGVEIWRSATGNPGSWAQINSDGFGSSGTLQDITMETFGSHLYVGLGRDYTAELWCWDGDSWSVVFQGGLGNPNNSMVSSFAEFQGYFYMGLRNTENGGQVWRSTDGTSWSPVFTGGLGNVDNGRPYGLITFEGYLYLVFSNTETGAEVWRSHDGTQWTLVMDKGWGDSKNAYVDYFDKGAVVFNGSLFIGASNSGNGAQIWQMLHQIYLPLILK